MVPEFRFSQEKRMNRVAVGFIFLAVFFTSAAPTSQAQVNSVLGSIDCGGGQATCFQQSTGTSGAVRCTCSAKCLGSSCITSSVASTRAVQWGQTPLHPCIFSVT